MLAKEKLFFVPLFNNLSENTEDQEQVFIYTFMISIKKSSSIQIKY